MRTDVLVVGGGSAGAGAAWRAALCGKKTVLIESGGCLGGTSTLGGVNEWEPGIASFGLNRHLFEDMGRGAALGRGPAPCREGHIGLVARREGLTYEASLRRAGLLPEQWTRVMFEPEALARAMDGELRRVGVTVLPNTSASQVETAHGRVTAVRTTASPDGFSGRIAANVVIDCTADAALLRKAGCGVMFGEESRAVFGEPSAPENAGSALNGVSLMFRVERGARPDELPEWTRRHESAAKWLAANRPVSHVSEYPDGSRCVNPLPIMTGADYFALPPGKRYEECLARTWLYWQMLKDEYGHDGWHIARVAPRAGVRESWRLSALDVLTERDVRGGFRRQGADTVALADHALDTHGAGAGPKELREAYGVPMGCLIAKEWENLIAAGRCCGFSHIAAASCRLSRTMMDLGEAAGALASLGGDLRENRADRVRALLGFERYLDYADELYR